MLKYTLFVFLVFSFTIQLFAQNKKIIADRWLKNNEALLGIKAEHSLDMLFSRSGLSGDTFRYYQTINGVQVFNAEVTIHISNSNEVTYHASTYKKNVELINTIPNLLEEETFKIALNDLEIQSSDVLQKENKLFLLVKDNVTTLVRRVYVLAHSKTGAWEVMVNVKNGEVLSSKNIAVYHKPNHKSKKTKRKTHTKASTSTTGTGFIYNTDPLTATVSNYGGQYVDNNDETNTLLDAARTFVNLPDIDFTTGQYTLKNSYVEIAELDLPNKGLFIQPSNDFSFNRKQDGFEAVNVFYHIDKNMRYINNDLNIALSPPQNGGVIRFDPHGSGGADNSFYSAGTLVFGEGCVDDGEDVDVILHELGHGLHDWITNGGLSQVNGLSEGCGDYWANSYKRSLGLWQNEDVAYYYVFGWDGHNTCWNGRTTNYPNLYPDGLVGGGPHIDGQIWASVMMEIWEILGREKTDKAFLEGLGMTNNGTNQEQAAIAVRQAAIDMGTSGGFTCEDIQVFTDKFTERGYNLPLYVCTLSIADFSTDKISIFPNPASLAITFKGLSLDTEISVFNMLGQTVINKIISRKDNNLDVSKLIEGAYFIKVKDNSLILKFIKQ